MNHIDAVIDALVMQRVRRATKYVSPKLVVRAHRIGKIDHRDPDLDIRVKIGKPNFHERQFIKDCIKAGEKFPVRKIQLARFRVLKPKAKVKKKSRR